MMIADFHIALELSARQGPIRIRTWKEGSEISDTFVIRPDAFFQLTDSRLPEGSNTRTFLLEADRSTILIKSREPRLPVIFLALFERVYTADSHQRAGAR